jgi:hypothetical protein
MMADRNGAKPSFGELASDAIRFWEPRRPLYNTALAAVVLIHFFAAWPASRAFLTRDMLLGLFVLAVVANVCYCAAYVVDLFAQSSAARGGWPRRRWALFVTGTAFAAVLAHFISMNALATGA